MNRRLLYRNISYQTLYQILSNALGFFFVIVLTQTSSQFEFGVYSYIFSTLVIVNMFLELGIPTYLLRHWSTHPEDFQKEKGVALGTRIYIAVPISLLLFGYVFGIDRFVSLEFLLAYIYFLLDGYLQINKMFLSSQDHFHLTAVIDASEKAVSYLGGMWILRHGGDLTQVFGLFIVAKAVAILLSSLYTKGVIIPSFDLKKSIALLRRSIPLFLLSVFGILYFRIDMLMIRYILGIEAVAPYSTAYRLMDAAVIFPGIFLAVAVPTLTKFYEEGSKAKLEKALKLCVKYLSIVALPFAAICVLYSEPMLTALFGPSYTNAAQILSVFGITTIFLYWNAPLSYFLYTGHRESTHSKILLFLTLVNVGCNILLLPALGTVGAAFSTLTCEIVGFILMQRYIGVGFPVKQVLIPIGCIIASSILTVIFHPVWYVGCLLLCLTFIVFLVLTRSLNLNELLLREKF